VAIAKALIAPGISNYVAEQQAAGNDRLFPNRSAPISRAGDDLLCTPQAFAKLHIS
jgi:hypothetical protein